MTTIDGIHTYYEGDVQYPYADVGAPELLHISSVTQENRRDFNYTCPCCQKRLRPRLGNKNRHCFFHDKGSRCSMDKYIHDTAERLLKEKWGRDEPFEIMLTVTRQCKNHDKCYFRRRKGRDFCTEKRIEHFDLKKHYQECLVEKNYENFRPDLMLVDNTDKYDPIFIEIWYKHKSEEVKIRSDHKIIEIRLKSVEDLQPLVQNPIAESETISFYNFKKVMVSPKESGNFKLSKFVLYPSMKSYFTPSPEINCWEYDTHHYKHPMLEITADLRGCAGIEDFHQLCKYIALRRGYNVKDCYQCAHCRRNYEADENSSDTIYCKMLSTPEEKHICPHTDGRHCDSFELNETRYRNLWIQFSSSRKLIWPESATIFPPCT